MQKGIPIWSGVELTPGGVPLPKPAISYILTLGEVIRINIRKNYACQLRDNKCSVMSNAP